MMIESYVLFKLYTTSQICLV